MGWQAGCRMGLSDHEAVLASRRRWGDSGLWQSDVKSGVEVAVGEADVRALIERWRGGGGDGADLAAARGLLEGLPGREFSKPKQIVAARDGVLSRIFRTRDKGSGARFVLKIDHGLTAEQMRADARFQDRIAQRLSAQEGFAAPRVIARWKDPPAMLMEEADGQSVRWFLHKKQPVAVAEAHRRAGAWLKAFQETAGQRHRGFSGQMMLDGVRVRQGWQGLPDPQAFGDGLRVLERLVAQAEGQIAPAGLVHGDFHPGNIIMNETVVTGIDMGKRARGFAHRDLARLLVHGAVTAPVAVFDASMEDARLGRYRAALLAGFGDVPEPVLDAACLAAILRWWAVVGTRAPLKERDREVYRRLRVLGKNLYDF